jgi:hypothetical protein
MMLSLSVSIPVEANISAITAKNGDFFGKTFLSVPFLKTVIPSPVFRRNLPGIQVLIHVISLSGLQGH